MSTLRRSTDLVFSDEPTLQVPPCNGGIITEKEWLASRRSNLPKGLRFVERVQGPGKYEFYVTKALRAKFKSSWSELYKIEAIKEFQSYRKEYDKIKASRREHRLDDIRRDVLKREALYYEEMKERTPKRLRPSASDLRIMIPLVPKSKKLESTNDQAKANEDSSTTSSWTTEELFKMA